MHSVPYQYHNAPIQGGGYVTGFHFHPNVPGILYARTDFGGTYRFEGQRWKSLIDHVSMEDLALTFPIALALDPKDPNLIYIMSGVNGAGNGVFSISRDRGDTFEKITIPITVHGNLSGRGTGFRLVVDPGDSNTLYFASQLDGLWRA